MAEISVCLVYHQIRDLMLNEGSIGASHSWHADSRHKRHDRYDCHNLPRSPAAGFRDSDRRIAVAPRLEQFPGQKALALL